MFDWGLTKAQTRSMLAVLLLCCTLYSSTHCDCLRLLFFAFSHLRWCICNDSSTFVFNNSPFDLCCCFLRLLLLQATQLINRLTPQKPARPAASDISKDE
jgi:hypothetical protein